MEEQDVVKADSVITKLLSLMEADPGFAGFSTTIPMVNALIEDDSGDSRALVGAILRDVGLTAKLVRLSNGGSRGTRSVSTVDQALSVLGLATAGKTAESLTPPDALSNKKQLRQLQAEAIASYFCGTFAALVTRFNGARFKPQETQVCAMMQNLGRLMATYYLFDELEACRLRQAEKNISESEALVQKLGYTYEQIGAAIAQAWHLPDGFHLGLEATKGKTQPKASPNPADWQLTCSLFARHITDIVFRMPEEREKMEIKNEANYFRQALYLKDDELAEWIEAALGDTENVMGQMASPLSVAQARTLLRRASERVHDVISPQDSLAKSSGGHKSPIDQINLAMRILHGEFEFDLTMVLVPEGSTGLLAITGIGRHAHQVVPKFNCHGPKPDLFRLMHGKMADIFVPDTTSPAFVKLLPDWYAGTVGARSFQLTALRHEGKCFGMLYGDYTSAHAAVVQDKPPETLQRWYDMLTAALDPKNH